MRSTVYTKDAKHPRIVIEINVDIDLLVACVKDGELDPGEVSAQLTKVVQKIGEALHKGMAQKAQQEE